MLDLVFMAQAANDVRVSLPINGLLALLAGILILILPRILNYIVAIYLILIGLVQIFNIRI